MAPLKVRILSRKFIKPSNPTPQHLRNFKLSLFDQLAPPPYVNSIFYYSAKGENSLEGNPEIRLRLEKSLSEALSLFYPLAGRFVTDPFSIDCSDQGVEYLEAGVNKKLGDFLHGPKIVLLNHFLSCHLGENTNIVTSPILLIQINMFECGGIVIGVSISHKIADAFTLFTFVNGWASTSRAGSNAMPRPNFHNLASLFPVRDFSLINPLPPLSDVRAKIVTKSFVFDGKTILELKSKFNSTHNEGRQPTRVVVVMALLWGALIKAKHGHLRPPLLSSSMTLRQKLALPELVNSFGNLWTVFNVQFDANKSKMELGQLVALLGDAIRETKMAFVDQGIDDICLKVSNAYRELNEALVNTNEAGVCLFTSWCNLPIYEADFGWGKPIWVSDASRAFEVVSLMDQKSGDGIEVWVSLNEKDMLVFERDPNILAFTSK